MFLPYDQLRVDHPLLGGPPAETGIVYVETTAKPAAAALPQAEARAASLRDASRRARTRREGTPGPLSLLGALVRRGASARSRQSSASTPSRPSPRRRPRCASPSRSSQWLTLHPDTLFVTDNDLYRVGLPEAGATAPRALLPRGTQAHRPADGRGPPGGRGVEPGQGEPPDLAGRPAGPGPRRLHPRRHHPRGDRPRRGSDIRTASAPPTGSTGR